MILIIYNNLAIAVLTAKEDHQVIIRLIYRPALF